MERTEPIYFTDAYARDSAAKVTAITDEGGIVLDRTVFYPTGGGQPGDSGWLNWDKQRMPIATTVKGLDGSIILVPAEPEEIPQPGTHVTQKLDWDRLLHLLSVVVPFPVVGGQISATHGRLDFDLADAPEDRDGIEDALASYIAQDLPITDH